MRTRPVSPPNSGATSAREMGERTNADRDAFLLESLRQAAPMLQNLACRYRVDFEDLYQDAAVVALERAEQAQRRGRAWLHATLRGEALNTITRKRGPIALQLDMVINEK